MNELKSWLLQVPGSWLNGGLRIYATWKGSMVQLPCIGLWCPLANRYFLGVAVAIYFHHFVSGYYFIPYIHQPSRSPLITAQWELEKGSRDWPVWGRKTWEKSRKKFFPQKMAAIFIPSRKLTARTWKLMVGSDEFSFGKTSLGELLHSGERKTISYKNLGPWNRWIKHVDASEIPANHIWYGTCIYSRNPIIFSDD